MSTWCGYTCVCSTFAVAGQTFLSADELRVNIWVCPVPSRAALLCHNPGLWWCSMFVAWQDLNRTDTTLNAIDLKPPEADG